MRTGRGGPGRVEKQADSTSQLSSQRRKVKTTEATPNNDRNVEVSQPTDWMSKSSSSGDSDHTGAGRRGANKVGKQRQRQVSELREGCG